MPLPALPSEIIEETSGLCGRHVHQVQGMLLTRVSVPRTLLASAQSCAPPATLDPGFHHCMSVRIVMIIFFHSQSCHLLWEVHGESPVTATTQSSSIFISNHSLFSLGKLDLRHPILECRRAYEDLRSTSKGLGYIVPDFGVPCGNILHLHACTFSLVNLILSAKSVVHRL